MQIREGGCGARAKDYTSARETKPVIFEAGRHSSSPYRRTTTAVTVNVKSDACRAVKWILGRCAAHQTHYV